MAFELVYTSSQTGVKQGSTGFCTVACTRGIDPRLMLTLEGLSGYKPIYPHYDAKAMLNPVSCSHYIFGGSTAIYRHILSRACFNGVDYTGRSNKLVSHLALSQLEANTAAGGPASLFLCDGLFKEADWQIKSEIFPKQKEIPPTHAVASKCHAWERVCGDSGWAGVIVEKYLSGKGIVYLVFDPGSGVDMLALMNEAIALLPENERWRLTFSTYFTSLPAGMECAWRACVPDSGALVAARRSPLNLIIDITKPLPPAEGGEYVRLARGEIASISPMQTQCKPDMARVHSVVEEPQGEAPQASKDVIRPNALLNASDKGKPGLGLASILVFATCILLLLCVAFNLVWWRFYGGTSIQPSAEEAEETTEVSEAEKLVKPSKAAKTDEKPKAAKAAEPKPESKPEPKPEPKTEQQAEEPPAAEPQPQVEAAFLWELYPQVQRITAEKGLTVDLPDELLAENTELYFQRNGKKTRQNAEVRGNALTVALADMNGRRIELCLTFEEKRLKMELDRFRMPANTCICLRDLRNNNEYPLYFEPSVSRVRNTEFKAVYKVMNYNAASQRARYQVEFGNPFGDSDLFGSMKMLVQFGLNEKFLDCQVNDKGRFVVQFDYLAMEAQKDELNKCNSALNRNEAAISSNQAELKKLNTKLTDVNKKIAEKNKKNGNEEGKVSKKHPKAKDDNKKKTGNTQDEIEELKNAKEDLKARIAAITNKISELNEVHQKLLKEREDIVNHKNDMLKIPPPQGHVFLHQNGQLFFLGTLQYKNDK